MPSRRLCRPSASLARRRFSSPPASWTRRRPSMAKPTPARVFTAFDYDHDESLRNLLVGQSKHEDSPFEMHDWSVKEPFTGDWKKKVREHICKVAQVVVLCGEY